MRLSSPPPLTLSSPTSCHTALADSVPLATWSTSSPARLTPTSLLFMDDRPITPPPETCEPTAPSTPIGPDQESRTAQIIADIKAKAYAAAVSSPDSVCAELKELGYHDSSSDESEEDFMMILNKFDKGKGKEYVSASNCYVVQNNNTTPHSGELPHLLQSTRSHVLAQLRLLVHYLQKCTQSRWLRLVLFDPDSSVSRSRHSRLNRT